MSGCCQEKILDTEKLDTLLESYRGQPSALIEVLHQAQDMFGYLPREVQRKIAKALGVSPSVVYSVVSFYSRFSIRPQGKHKVCVCKGTACYVKGSPEILERFEKELGIEVGKCTEDGKFSLDACRCIGACGLAPVIMINDDVYGRLKPEDVKGIIQKYKDMTE